MKTNPFIVPLAAAGGILSLIGVILTVLALTTTTSWIMSVGPLLLGIAGLLVAVGVPVLVGALVLAGVDWRMRNA